MFLLWPNIQEKTFHIYWTGVGWRLDPRLTLCAQLTFRSMFLKCEALNEYQRMSTKTQLTVISTLFAGDALVNVRRRFAGHSASSHLSISFIRLFFKISPTILHPHRSDRSSNVFLNRFLLAFYRLILKTASPAKRWPQWFQFCCAFIPIHSPKSDLWLLVDTRNSLNAPCLFILFALLVL